MGEARPAEIVSETRLPRSTVSYALKKLLEKGVIVVLDGSEAKNSPMRAYRLAEGGIRQKSVLGTLGASALCEVGGAKGGV